jgi:hypothetical protein
MKLYESDSLVENLGLVRRVSSAVGRVLNPPYVDGEIEVALERRIETHGPKGFRIVPTAEALITEYHQPESGPYPLPGIPTQF